MSCGHGTSSLRHRPSQHESPTSDLAAFVDSQLRSGSHYIYADAVALLDRYLITRVLQHTRGNQSQTAKLLGITRGSLRNKIRSLHISLGRKSLLMLTAMRRQPADPPVRALFLIDRGGHMERKENGSGILKAARIDNSNSPRQLGMVLKLRTRVL